MDPYDPSILESALVDVMQKVTTGGKIGNFNVSYDAAGHFGEVQIGGMHSQLERL